jgi:hypothetical protein
VVGLASPPADRDALDGGRQEDDRAAVLRDAVENVVVDEALDVELPQNELLGGDCDVNKALSATGLLPANLVHRSLGAARLSFHVAHR